MKTTKTFDDFLQDPDHRSIGKPNELTHLINTQADFDTLFAQVFDGDKKVAQRALDTIEKITYQNFNYLSKHKKALLHLCKTVTGNGCKWHLAQLLPRLQLSKKEKAIVWKILENWATNKTEGKVVRVNSVHSLYHLMLLDPPTYEDAFKEIVSVVLRENIPSMHARIRNLEKLSNKRFPNATK